MSTEKKIKVGNIEIKPSEVLNVIDRMVVYKKKVTIRIVTPKGQKVITFKNDLEARKAIKKLKNIGEA